MGKPQYLQTFRKEWLNKKEFKHWLLEVEGESSKAKFRFCKLILNAKNFDFEQHMNSKKHKTAHSFFSSYRSLGTFLNPNCSLSTSSAEGNLSLFIVAHFSILSVDHLGELCKTHFKGSEAAVNLKLHRTKTTNIINNVLAPHFNDDPISSIGDSPYSVLIYESTDISVLKFLGISIICFNKSLGNIIPTYLALAELETCDAQSIVDVIKKKLNAKG